MKYLLIIIIILITFLQGCYYDKAFLNQATACDTAIVTYSGSVSPVLTAYCTTCHTGINAPLGIRLDNYAGVKAQAINGKLLGVINHSPGFIPMPQNGTMLSKCNIAKIRIWIGQGAPQN